MTRLGLVLNTDDLPLAELCSVRLDGELFAVDDCYLPVDIPETSQHRAAALARTFGTRHIAERMSAAWIYGALPSPPIRHELCAGIAGRVHSWPSQRIVVREVVIATHELTLIGALNVTTPVRTITDIARSTTNFTSVERRVIATLMRIGNVTFDECELRLGSSSHLPHKRRALERISQCT